MNAAVPSAKDCLAVRGRAKLVPCFFRVWPTCRLFSELLVFTPVISAKRYHTSHVFISCRLCRAKQEQKSGLDRRQQMMVALTAPRIVG
jgi:hypothetical protein